MDILDQYILKKPGAQNILDLFEGEWSSKLPDQFGLNAVPGAAALFEDARIDWASQVFGSLVNQRILELGPLEGGHSYMFQQGNARSVVAIEANARAFLKCICIKEILHLDRVRFLLGDFMAFLQETDEEFDMVFASGVLYHMEDPLLLLKLLSDTADKLYLWTHYYDQEVITGREDLDRKFEPMSEVEFEGQVYQGSVQAYNEALDWSGFCGGPKPVSRWLTKQSIMQALQNFGYKDLQINFDAPDHPNGPSFSVCAVK